MKSTQKNPYRLDRTVVPSAYRIYLTPDLDAATFSGRVEIDVNVAEPVLSFTLNANHLTLGSAQFASSDTIHVSQQPILDTTYETATFKFDEALPKGPATVSISFNGILNDKLAGFYRSTFTDVAGVTHTIATTQFEQCDARQAFPCWDEPSFKATYQVNLTVPTHLAAYSNSPIVSNTDLGNGLRTVSYAPTMKMSTYLVAFVVGPFEETEAVDVLGTPLRVVYPPGKAHLAKFAMESGVFALKFFSEYFNIPYPGEKLDLIAVPDFAFGAMENLGCVTFRETALLVDPSTASLAEIERVATVVSHEIAHMWFGDLVTMEWWEGIWLNEAFATFMEVLCVNTFKPQWKMWVGFGIARDAALQIDGLHTTRPIEYEVISPSDTRGMFDVLTYQKGGSVLRMLEQYLGEEVFRDGIRHYLTKHSYANTITTDLWDALEEVSKQPVRNLMNTWILQGGYPLVTFEDGKLTQQPFAYGPAKGKSAIGKSWQIPVLTRSLQGGAVCRHLLADQPIVVSDAAPVVINAGASGVFRSRYGKNELAALVPHIDQLEELERATLVADSWASLFSGRITWEDFYAIAQGLGDQNEPTPWMSVATAVDFVHRALHGRENTKFISQVEALFLPQFERLGWNAKANESELTPQLRAIVLNILGTLCKHAGIRSEALKRFEAKSLDGDLAQAILRIVADQERPGDYEAFLLHYTNAKDPQEKQRYLLALGGFSRLDTALDAAQRCFTEFRTQDAPMVLGVLSRNVKTGPRVWAYVMERWDDVLKKFPQNLVTRAAMGIPTFISDDDFARTVEVFHTSHPLEGDQRAIEQQLERMQIGLTFCKAIRQQF